jgi:hypothetical protein
MQESPLFGDQLLPQGLGGAGAWQFQGEPEDHEQEEYLVNSEEEGQFRAEELAELPLAPGELDMLDIDDHVSAGAACSSIAVS